MRMLIRIFLFVFIFSIIYSPFFSQTEAEGEFQTDYNVSYRIDQHGRTNVRQEINLTNKTTRYYATKFSLSLGVTKVTNVKASDNLGSLEAVSSFDNNTTNIDVILAQKVVGFDKVYNFVLEYDAPELTTKAGQIWEINIPRLANSQDIATYNLAVQVPAAFGPAVFITPTAVSKIENQKSGFGQNQNIYKFNKEQLVKSGISASFGSRQIFSFTLKYHLNNPNITPAIFEIALPPDSSYQKVIYSAINPKPIDVAIDKDGNWLARYQLTSRKKIDVTAAGQVEIYPAAKKEVEPILTEAEKQNYLVAQPFWDVENQTLAKKAKELKTAEQIYNFVANYLKYDQKRLEAEVVRRLGASSAFENPQSAVCMEFTDLFITLTRAAGIPAREVNGFAYSQNERLRPLSLRSPGVDILHAWPEYWDDAQGWIAVDPTWGATSGGIDYFSKLDFNHFTFVRKGLSSQSPLPAGAYKYEQNQQGDVEVKLAATIMNLQSDFELNLEMPDKMVAGIPTTANLVIKNTGNTMLDNLSINIDLKNLQSNSPKIIKINNLPPFAKRKQTIRLTNYSFIKPEKGIITFTAGDKVVTKDITIKPAVLFLLIVIAAIILLVIIIILLARLLVKYKSKYQNLNGGKSTGPNKKTV